MEPTSHKLSTETPAEMPAETLTASPSVTIHAAADAAVGAASSSWLYVVSGRDGYIATYLDEDSVRREVLDKYSLLTFIVERFPVARDAALSHVWVVLHSADDSVKFVSNSRDQAERVRVGYAALGRAYEDPIDYWKRAVGVIAPELLEYLESVGQGHDLYAASAVAAERAQRQQEATAQLERLLAPNPDGPIARLLREEKRITLFDSVVDVEFYEPSDGKELVADVVAMEQTTQIGSGKEEIHMVETPATETSAAELASDDAEVTEI